MLDFLRGRGLKLLFTQLMYYIILLLIKKLVELNIDSFVLSLLFSGICIGTAYMFIASTLIGMFIGPIIELSDFICAFKLCSKPPALRSKGFSIIETRNLHYNNNLLDYYTLIFSEKNEHFGKTKSFLKRYVVKAFIRINKLFCLPINPCNNLIIQAYSDTVVLTHGWFTLRNLPAGFPKLSGLSQKNA
ncbi:hypothetical protein AGLY_005064 [Aphis glycines]|uniref:Uncharacterized protein n=1 Tax=Aphis glycines TaxID=307491 RepID=A0A6G0TVQ8_APHGL|nr:hypothetical protein AGLY_005064 [Aphis glycines]